MPWRIYLHESWPEPKLWLYKLWYIQLGLPCTLPLDDTGLLGEPFPIGKPRFQCNRHSQPHVSENPAVWHSQDMASQATNPGHFGYQLLLCVHAPFTFWIRYWMQHMDHHTSSWHDFTTGAPVASQLPSQGMMSAPDVGHLQWQLGWFHSCLFWILSRNSHTTSLHDIAAQGAINASPKDTH